MNLLIYTALTNDASKRFISIIAKFAQGEKTEIFNSPNSLIYRLTQIRKDQTIVVLLVTTEAELTSIVSFREFFEGVNLILILPNRGARTISKGHKLYPRYVSYVDSDFSDVDAVLRKMISKIRHGERIRWQLLDRMEEEDQENCLS